MQSLNYWVAGTGIIYWLFIYAAAGVSLQEQQLKMLNVQCVQMVPTPTAPFKFVNNIQSEFTCPEPANEDYQ